jgi:hypothetical protein
MQANLRLRATMAAMLRGPGRGGTAALAMLLVALALPALASAEAYTPPPKHSYFGVSDTGVVSSFKKFRGDVKSHPAVMQIPGAP